VDRVEDRRAVLIAGATGSIGGGAATSLAQRGVQVVILGRTQERLDARASAIRSALPEADRDEAAIDTLVLDFCDFDSVRSAAAEALDRYPAIDGLVLSVGLFAQDGPTILPNGHELMFATNVLGPFLFTQLLLARLQRSGALVLHVIAPFYEAIDWDDLESIRRFETDPAYHRAKTMDRMTAAELARRDAGSLSSVAFDPSFIIDKDDPSLKERWPSGFTGLYWRVLSALVAKPPRVAGEPIADLMLDADRDAINGALFKLGKRATKPDKAMSDMAACRRLWDELEAMTGTAVPSQ
jgi:NAD(P)-dependent dehydrogenase (short-subunit alcohol dehydrogenase family)